MPTSVSAPSIVTTCARCSRRSPAFLRDRGREDEAAEIDERREQLLADAKSAAALPS